MIKNLILLFLFVCAFQLKAQEQIADRYNLAGGRGAESSRVLVGQITDNLPINYYLSYNVTSQGDLWMLHLIPWTQYEVEIPYEAKVLIKTFGDNIIELTAFTCEDGVRLTTVNCNGTSYDRFISEIHCKLSESQLEQLISDGVKKIRIQTTMPKGFVEREYDNMAVALTLSRGCSILREELKPIDIYEGF